MIYDGEMMAEKISWPHYLSHIYLNISKPLLNFAFFKNTHDTNTYSQLRVPVSGSLCLPAPVCCVHIHLFVYRPHVAVWFTWYDKYNGYYKRAQECRNDFWCCRYGGAEPGDRTMVSVMSVVISDILHQRLFLKDFVDLPFVIPY